MDKDSLQAMLSTMGTLRRAIGLLDEALSNFDNALSDVYGPTADQRFTMEMTADEADDWLRG